MRLLASATWDGTDTAGFAAVAGDARADGPDVLVAGLSGEEVRVRPGWTVLKWEGRDGVMVCAPEAWEIVSVLAREAGALAA